MIKKVISINIYKTLSQVEDIHSALTVAYKTPYYLSNRDKTIYLKSNIIDNIDFQIRQLYPSDNNFIKSWEQDIASDIAWFSQKNRHLRAIKNLPFTIKLPQYSFGLISTINKKENLEGFVSFFPSTLGNNICLSISQMELYYQNIGKYKKIDGISNMFIDFAIKFATEITGNTLGITINPVTPGSLKMVSTHKFAFTRDRYFLTPDHTFNLYRKNLLEQQFENNIIDFQKTKISRRAL